MMNHLPGPLVSFVVATHNRRAVVTKTLAHLQHCGLSRTDYEIIVVDNASDDGTPDAIASESDTVIRLQHNAGSCAKSYGVDRATGGYIVFLDDDSYPHPGSVPRMIERFEADPQLGAAGFTVHLPDGKKEGGALPDVFLGCGVGFRAEALRESGGLDRSLFMQAEEYDLAFRLEQRGWRVRMFHDLHIDHLKTSCARRSERTTYYDIRNNLRILARYLPRAAYTVYREDCLQRYDWLSRRDGHQPAFLRGARAGRWRGAMERWTYRKHRLSAQVLERFFRWRYIHGRMKDLAASGIDRILLADLGKNIYAYYRAVNMVGITVEAIGDDRFAAPRRHYRGIEILSLEKAMNGRAEAVVVSNSSPVHGTDTCHRVAALTAQPVHHWFGVTEEEKAGGEWPVDTSSTRFDLTYA